jgi:hypothetical protein
MLCGKIERTEKIEHVNSKHRITDMNMSDKIELQTRGIVR